MKATLTIPSKLREISLGQWMKFSSMTKDIDDEVFLQEKTVEILCGLPLDLVRSLEYTSVGDITQALAEVLQEKPKFEKTFVMRGTEYGFIPSLDDMTFGEYIDLDNYLADAEQIHKAMAVLFRPVKNKMGDQYLIEPYDIKTKHNMKEMPVDVALGALDFFLSLKTELLNLMINCLERETLQLTPQQRRDLQNAGAGINASFNLLMDASKSLTR